MKKSLILILVLAFSPTLSYSASLKTYEKGQLAGSLGFGAMTMDAYYEICTSQGTRLDNYLNGINKLLKMKWGFTFSEIAKKQEELTGRDFRQEAHKLVNTMKQKFGGCNTSGMNQWFRTIQDLYKKKLNKFHSVQ